jgi:hypothetical protein
LARKKENIKEQKRALLRREKCYSMRKEDKSFACVVSDEIDGGDRKSVEMAMRKEVE